MTNRVLLVGRWPDPARCRTGFPEQRTEGVLAALQAAGHEVRVAGLVPPGGQAAPGATAVEEEGPGWIEEVARVGEGCELVVAAGPHNPGRVAALVAGDRPLWVDVPGDPFAEVQAEALRAGAPQPARQAGAQAAALPALCRADAFSVIGDRQRLLLLGQLGLLGRLATGDRDPVAVVPNTWPPGPARPPVPRPPGTPLVLLLAGAEPPWLDLPGLEAAVAACQGREVDRLVRTRSLPPEALARAVAACHLAVFLDRPGLEPETGSRTRALFGLHQGLPLVGSPHTELAQDLARRGVLRPVGPDGLAAALRRAFAEGDDGRAVAAAQADLARALAPAVAWAPLLAFARAPWRLPPLPSPFADLAAAHAALRDERARLHHSPSFRLAHRLHRAWLGLTGRPTRPPGS